MGKPLYPLSERARLEELLSQFIQRIKQSERLDDFALNAAFRKANTGVADNAKHLAKRHLLAFYLEIKESEPQTLARLGIDAAMVEELDRVLRMKPQRTASGVATITVITKPQPCSGDCVFCPNDMRMPKSYLHDEPACQRAERNFFDPYLQVASRLQTLERMGHVTGKVELIVLGGTWSDYAQEYQQFYIHELFRALNDDAATRAREVETRRAAYEEAGISADVQELARRVASVQKRVDNGELRYNQAWPLLYGEGTPWEEIAAWQQVSIEEVEAQHRINESCEHRVVGLVVETRPDAVTPQRLTLMRRLGCTKVQIGVQSISQATLDANERGTQVARLQEAFSLLRLFGFKIHAHFMANLLGATPKDDVEEYRSFVASPAYQPDEIKMYPCALIDGTRLIKHFEDGSWQPYSTDELTDVLCANIAATPPWTRVSRMMRDFTAEDIKAGTKQTNLRQAVEERLSESSEPVQEMRYREVRRKQVAQGELTLDVVEYETLVSDERFLQWVTAEGRLAGFLRLSLPKREAYSADLPVKAGEAMIREVHVYGVVAAVDGASEGVQHHGLGRQLVERAARIARDAGYERLNVISAVGTRNYYRSLGFADAGLYQQLEL